MYAITVFGERRLRDKEKTRGCSEKKINLVVD